MVDMAITSVFNNEVVNDEDEEYGAPFLVPKDRGGGGVVVTLCVEARSEELFGKHTSLG